MKRAPLFLFFMLPTLLLSSCLFSFSPSYTEITLPELEKLEAAPGASIAFDQPPVLFLQDIGLVIPVIITILGPILWLIFLIDVLRSSFVAPNDKLVWVIVVTLFPIIGPLLYLFIGRKKRIKQ